jgi:hypothetical protein
MPFFHRKSSFWQIWWTRPDKEFCVREGKTGTDGKLKGTFSFEDPNLARERFQERVDAQVEAGWEPDEEQFTNTVKTSVAQKHKPKGKKSGGKALDGVTVCFTGAQPRPRAELEAMVEAAGGDCLSGVSSNLTYLVMADPNSNSTKARKAREVGTICITLGALEELIGKAKPKAVAAKKAAAKKPAAKKPTTKAKAKKPVAKAKAKPTELVSSVPRRKKKK